MAQRTRHHRHKGVAVTVFDPVAGESFSLTVYPSASGASIIAEVIEEELRKRWDVTSLSDKRHKRR